MEFLSWFWGRRSSSGRPGAEREILFRISRQAEQGAAGQQMIYRRRKFLFCTPHDDATTFAPRRTVAPSHDPGIMENTPLPPNDINALVEGLNRLACNLWGTWDQDTLEIFHHL